MDCGYNRRREHKKTSSPHHDETQANGGTKGENATVVSSLRLRERPALYVTELRGAKDRIKTEDSLFRGVGDTHFSSEYIGRPKVNR